MGLQAGIFLAILSLAFALSKHLPPPYSNSVRSTHSTRQLPLLGTLFGPIYLPSTPAQTANVTLINFNDEVFDISSISIFGGINDGGCSEVEDAPQPMADGASRTVVLGPGVLPWDAAQVRSAQVTLINFNDEVFDISSISVFGDVNDGTCPLA